MKTLLVGTDFSARSERAVKRATELARDHGFEVVVAAVAEASQGDGDPAARLQEIARQIESTGVACRSELRSGRPAEELAELARESGASLMVIGPQRPATLRDVFGRITAERIIELSPLPLLATNGEQDGPYRRLLVPVEFDEQSRHAAWIVRELPIAAEAEIVLLYVYDTPAREMLGRAMVTSDEKADYLAECATAAHDGLREFASSAGLEGARLTVIEATAPTGEMIERSARNLNADLVVLSRSSKGAVAQGIVGSVTRDVLRAANLDVVMVPELQSNATELS